MRSFIDGKMFAAGEMRLIDIAFRQPKTTTPMGKSNVESQKELKLRKR